MGFNGDFMVIYGDLMGFMGIYRGYNGIYHLVMTFTVCHGKIHHAIKFGKPRFLPCISIRAIYTMAMLNSQRVISVTSSMNVS